MKGTGSWALSVGPNLNGLGREGPGLECWGPRLGLNVQKPGRLLPKSLHVVINNSVNKVYKLL